MGIPQNDDNLWLSSQIKWIPPFSSHKPTIKRERERKKKKKLKDKSDLTISFLGFPFFHFIILLLKDFLLLRYQIGSNKFYFGLIGLSFCYLLHNTSVHTTTQLSRKSLLLGIIKVCRIKKKPRSYYINEHTTSR